MKRLTTIVTIDANRLQIRAPPPRACSTKILACYLWAVDAGCWLHVVAVGRGRCDVGVEGLRHCTAVQRCSRWLQHMTVVCLMRRTVGLLQLPHVAWLRHAVRLMHTICGLHHGAASIRMRRRAAIWLKWLLQQCINQEHVCVWSSMMQPAGHMEGK